MKKIALTILAFALFIPAGAFAVSPHPDVIRKWKEDGTFNEKIAQYYERERKHAEERAAAASDDNNDGILKVSRSSGNNVTALSSPSGNRSYPVILIQFPGKTESSASSFPPIAVSLLFLVLVGASAPLAFRFRRRRLAHAALVLAIVPGLFALSPRCGGSSVVGDEEDLHLTFSGTAQFDSQSTPEFYKSLFETGTRSMKKYYEDMSNDTFHPTFDIYGPYTANHSHDYYGTNYGGDNAHSISLAYEAIKKLIADKSSEVNFSKYDHDGNSIVDGVIIIHQGAGDEVDGDTDSANNIWSFMSSVSGISANGVNFRNYSVLPEYHLEPGDTTIGVFCHEFSHVLGLPDLYDTTYATNGVGNWSLMAGGSWNGPSRNGSIPAPLLAWERNELGWMTEIKNVATGSNTVTDINTSFSAVKVPLHPDTFNSQTYEQYLLVENIVKTPGTWAEYLPGEGLLITKIDEYFIAGTRPTNMINGAKDESGTYMKVHGVNVMEAGYTASTSMWAASSNQGLATDTYPNGTVTSIGPDTASPFDGPNTNYTNYDSNGDVPSEYNANSGVTISNRLLKNSLRY